MGKDKRVAELQPVHLGVRNLEPSLTRDDLLTVEIRGVSVLGKNDKYARAPVCYMEVEGKHLTGRTLCQ